MLREAELIIDIKPAVTEIQISRVRRTMLEKLFLWQRAYQTKILGQNCEVVGLGPIVNSQTRSHMRMQASFTKAR